MTDAAPWPSQAYLEILRPEPGYTLKGAILTSYSADLAAIVAALLALAGFHRDEGGGRKTDLAEAVEQLRGKVRILIQRGGLARPKRIPTMAGILDQFIRQIDFDERKHSWHPKIALLQFTNSEDQSDWRLWLGSRNLTASTNHDFGLSLTSTNDPKAANAAALPGAAELAGRLAVEAGLDAFRPAKLKSVFKDIRWTQPESMTVERIVLTSGKGTDTVPRPDSDVDEVIAVSPFLDGTVIKAIGAWGGPKTKRRLLSTQMELVKLAGQTARPLAGFNDNLFVLDTPTPEAVEPTTSISPDQASDEEGEDEQMLVGLHAKIFAARKGKKLRLWVGSANATQRAWEGKNVEVMAEIAATLRVQEGLTALLNKARPVSLSQLEVMPVPEEGTATDRLDEARKAVVADWKGKLVRDGNVFTVVCEAPPHPSDPSVKLEAGLATGSLIDWSRGSPSLFLGEYPAALHTQLLQFRLSIDGLQCTWLQCVDVTPALDDDRDRQAIAHHLGTADFLAWIAALMTGENHGGSDDSWDKPLISGSPNGMPLTNLLTLDAMLGCWARDHVQFKRIADRVESYLEPVIAQATALSGQDRKRLSDFQTVWSTVSLELLKES
jgi:hypothetical protein